VNELIHTPIFQIYVVSSFILVLNMQVLAGATAAIRSKGGNFLNPEDKALNKAGQLIEVDSGRAARFRRAHYNAMENVLPFLGVGLLLVLTQPSVAVAASLFGVFTLFRLIHSFAYVRGVQPLRTMSFAISSFALTGIVGTAAVRAFLG
jgi:uncharacterized MAPEG superfamily protein